MPWASCRILMGTPMEDICSVVGERLESYEMVENAVLDMSLLVPWFVGLSPDLRKSAN